MFTAYDSHYCSTEYDILKLPWKRNKITKPDRYGRFAGSKGFLLLPVTSEYHAADDASKATRRKFLLKAHKTLLQLYLVHSVVLVPIDVMSIVTS